MAKAAPWEGGGSTRAQRATPQLPLSAGQPQLGSRAEFTGSVTSVTYYTPVRCAPCWPCFRCCPCGPRLSRLPHFQTQLNALVHVHLPSLGQESQYGIIKVDVSAPGQRVKGPPVTVTGTMPPCAKGARVTFSGTWTQHREFGLQIKAEVVELALPDGRDVAGVEAFLAATVPGVGPKTAANLVEALGAERVLDVMNAAAQGDAAAGAKVRNVLKGRTAALLAGWSSGALQRDAVQALVNLGLPRGLASRAVEAKGVDVATSVKRCPFTALRGVKGCTFPVLDDLATQLGLPPSAPGRVQAAVLDRLSDKAVKGGHAFTPLADVARSCLDLLHAPRPGLATAAAAAQSGGFAPQGPHPQVHPDDVASALDGALGGRAPHEGDVYAALDALQRGTKVVVEAYEGESSGASPWPSGDDSPAEAMWQHEPSFGGDGDHQHWHPRSRVYLAQMHQDEVDVAKALASRAAAAASPAALPSDVATWLAGQEPALTEGQVECIATALTARGCVVTGGPGTGKSFVTAALVKLWRQRGASVRLCAPTGRAAQRLQELLTKQGMTCLPAPPLGRPPWAADSDAGREGGSGSGGASMFYTSETHDAQPHVVAAPSTVHRLLDFVPRGDKGRASQAGVADGAEDSGSSSAASAVDAADGPTDAGESLAYEGTFRRNAENPLDCDVLVVDEASMLDLPLAGALLRALPRHATLLLVGDQDQLLPVGPGSPLHDVLASRVLPVVALTEVVRTAATSLIASSSAAILAGRLPPLAPVHVEEEEEHAPVSGLKGLKLPPPRLPWDATSPKFDAGAASPVAATLAIKAGLDALWVRLPESYAGGSTDESGSGDASAAVAALQELIGFTLPGLGFTPADDLQVLSPMRKAAAGSAALCTKLGPLLNPPAAAGRPRVQHRSVVFSVGDRVLQTENDYTRGVFNGDLGVVTHVQPGTSGAAPSASSSRSGMPFGGSSMSQPGRVKSITVRFDTGGLTSAGGSSGVQVYTGDELSQLVPAWAVTVHKAQGCEFPVVALVLSPSHGISLQRNMLYTATSRASKLLIVLSSRRALQQALKNTHQSGRNSHLVARLQQQLGGAGAARGQTQASRGREPPAAAKAQPPTRRPMPWEVPVQAAAARGGWDAAPPF